MDPSQFKGNILLARRQQCACLIQEIGSRLQTTQVVINAGIYYMHHLYEVFSPETLKPILVSIATFYIACKTEDFSRKLSMLIKAAYDTLRKPMPNESSDVYKRIIQNIHALEATILMVIGFRTLEVKQPHVVLVNAIRTHNFPKEIAHTSYYICSNILHLTPLILNHSSEAIAASSLYIAAKWNSTAMEVTHGEWFHAIDKNLTIREIKEIAEIFTQCYQICDMRIKEQLKHTLKSKKLERSQRTDPNFLKKISQPADDYHKLNRHEKRDYEISSTENSRQHSNLHSDPKRHRHEKPYPDSTTHPRNYQDSSDNQNQFNQAQIISQNAPSQMPETVNWNNIQSLHHSRSSHQAANYQNHLQMGGMPPLVSGHVPTGNGASTLYTGQQTHRTSHQQPAMVKNDLHNLF